MDRAEELSPIPLPCECSLYGTMECKAVGGDPSLPDLLCQEEVTLIAIIALAVGWSTLLRGEQTILVPALS